MFIVQGISRIHHDEASVRDVYARVEPRSGQVYCEMSTAGIDAADELAPRLEAAGARLLCTPIMGSVPAIEQGAALILVGGDEAAFERARPALEAFGEPEHAGSYRDAMGLKLLNNAMLGACGAVASELLAASRRAGLDLDATFRLLTRMMPYLDARRRGYLARDHEATLFELAGMVKDMDLALDLGRRAGAAMPMTAVARELYAVAAPEHGEEELTAVIEVYPA